MRFAPFPCLYVMANVIEDQIDYPSIDFKEYSQIWLPLAANFLDLVISISSGQRNLMKTYHNDANTSGITKIAFKIFFNFF